MAPMACGCPGGGAAWEGWQRAGRPALRVPGVILKSLGCYTKELILQVTKVLSQGEAELSLQL